MNEETVYDDLDVPTVVNGTGTKTRISGSLMHAGAADAMRQASEAFVRLSDLQARASTLISDVTTAEAGYVTNGASAGLTLCAAACIAGTDIKTMDRLPDTAGIPSTIVMPRSHRNGYDHALRLAGATIADIGGNDQYLGTGANNTELWEFDRAIDDETVAVAYMEKSYSTPPLAAVVDVAHANDVPVIVDAAAELPPVSNLSAYIEAGADLVVFSGGKAIRGPQASGIVAGKQEYIESIALQTLDMHTAQSVWDPPRSLIDVEALDGVPRHGIGRGMKVGKEELVGLIYALQAFVDTDHQAAHTDWATRADSIASALQDCPGLSVEIEPAGAENRVPTVVAQLSANASKSAVDLVRDLRRETPRVFVGSDHLHLEQFTINPMCLSPDEASYLVDRITAHLA